MSNSNQGPIVISENVYMGVLGTFFAIALVFAAARISIRIYIWRRPFLDDYFFFAAVAALITSTVFFFLAIPKVYVSATILEDSELLREVKTVAVESNLAEGFAWVTLFSVKFSFLFYFRTLISKIRSAVILWWVTLAITVPVACVTITATAIMCPHTGNDILKYCISGPSFLKREKAIMIYLIATDILTDILLISVPIVLLNQTQFKVRQKIKIGIVLCLSIVMIAIEIIRSVFARYYGIGDQTWNSFLQQLLACISVIIACMAAFRTLFTVGPKQTRNHISPPAAPRYDENTSTTWMARLHRKKVQFLSDIDIESAMMDGMRTMIRENGKTIPSSDSFEILQQQSLAGTHDGTKMMPDLGGEDAMPGTERKDLWRSEHEAIEDVTL